MMSYKDSLIVANPYFAVKFIISYSLYEIRNMAYS